MPTQISLRSSFICPLILLFFMIVQLSFKVMITILTMQAQQLFQRASQQFQSNNYKHGLQILNHSISIMPNKSSLYSNRALFHSQLGNIDAAVQDLNNAIIYNSLNYVAYFNLFSLHYNNNNIELSFDNLCCSLSCLYLIRGKKYKRDLDVQKSIKYAENNMEAHLLKGLMYFDDGKFKLALNEIQWALDIQPKDITSMKLRNIIKKKIDPYSVEDFIQDHQDEPQINRLHTTYQPTEEYDEEIRTKVHEFNILYDELIGSQYGTVTQKVPRMKVGQVSLMNNHPHRDINEFSQIYEIKYVNRSIIKSRNIDTENILKDIQSDIPTKQLISSQDKDKGEESFLLEQGEENNKEKVTKSNKEKQEYILLDNQYQKSRSAENHEENETASKVNHKKSVQIEQKIKIIEKEIRKSMKKEDVEHQNTPSRSQSINRKNSASKSKGKNGKTPQKTFKNEVITNKSQMSQTSSLSTVNLYPIGQNKKIQFTVVSAQIKNPSNLKDLYLIGNYNSRKNQRIKTPNKKIQGNLVKWFTSVNPTLIAQTTQTVTVKVFSKQYFNYIDQQLGQGQVQVQVLKSGQLKIPIYFKNKISGFVNMRVDLL